MLRSLLVVLLLSGCGDKSSSKGKAVETSVADAAMVPCPSVPLGVVPLDDMAKASEEGVGKRCGRTTRGFRRATQARRRGQLLQALTAAIGVDRRCSSPRSRLLVADLLADLGRTNDAIAAFEKLESDPATKDTATEVLEVLRQRKAAPMTTALDKTPALLSGVAPSRDTLCRTLAKDAHPLLLVALARKLRPSDPVGAARLAGRAVARAQTEGKGTLRAMAQPTSDMSINALTFSARGRYLAAAGDDMICWWDLGRPELPHCVAQKNVAKIAFVGDKHMVGMSAHGKKRGSLTLWDLSEDSLAKTHTSKKTPFLDLAVARRSPVAAVAVSGGIQMWDVRRFVRKELVKASDAELVLLGAKGDRLAWAARGGSSIEGWSRKKRKAAPEVSLIPAAMLASDASGALYGIARERIETATNKTKLYLRAWTPDDKKISKLGEVAVAESVHEGERPLLAVAFDSADTRLFSLDSWSYLSTRGSARPRAIDHDKKVTAIAVRDDGKLLAVAVADMGIELRSARTNRVVARLVMTKQRYWAVIVGNRFDGTSGAAGTRLLKWEISKKILPGAVGEGLRRPGLLSQALGRSGFRPGN